MSSFSLWRGVWPLLLLGPVQFYQPTPEAGLTELMLVHDICTLKCVPLSVIKNKTKTLKLRDMGEDWLVFRIFIRTVLWCSLCLKWHISNKIVWRCWVLPKLFTLSLHPLKSPLTLCRLLMLFESSRAIRQEFPTKVPAIPPLKTRLH